MASPRWPRRLIATVSIFMLVMNVAFALVVGGNFWWQVLGTLGVIVLFAAGTIIGNVIADRTE
ncbi:MAG TPA: hypothetical protein VM143_06915 [Acidimicrobiales bacterium]|nr:hypothetical protein [Acidimicrobiales bacterium]